MVGKIVSQEYKEYTSHWHCHLVLTLRVVLSVTMMVVV